MRERNSLITRRECLLAGMAGLLHAADPRRSRLSLEGYIWQNYAAREKKPLLELLPELFAGAAYAGFRNIELNDGFFTPALRDQVVALTRSHELLMPSVYVGGTMHEADAADKTTAKALEIGAVCAEFGCRAVVHNPNTNAGQGRKTDAELAVQAESLNRMGRTLSERGFQLRVHHHTAELVEGCGSGATSFPTPIRSTSRYVWIWSMRSTEAWIQTRCCGKPVRA